MWCSVTDVDEDLQVGRPTSLIGLPHRVSQVLLSVHKLAVWVLALSLGLGGVLVATITHAQERFEFESYKDIERLFEQKVYTTEVWRAGIREVPRLYITNIPERWRAKTSKEISVATKKRLFFRLLGPFVLRANELIVGDRRRLERLAKESVTSEVDEAWAQALATRYKMGEMPNDAAIGDLIEALLMHVDIVPPSLALAQAAEESGWGTSRFADLGNALFGQWTWGGKGIVPREQRSGKGDYKIAAFESPQESVSAYMLNLNTHRAYEALRRARAELRAQGKKPRGSGLVGTLVDYSERGQAYVDTLKVIMRVNKLDPADDAFLGSEPPIYMDPVGAGKE